MERSAKENLKSQDAIFRVLVISERDTNKLEVLVTSAYAFKHTWIECTEPINVSKCDHFLNRVLFSPE